MKQVLSKFKLGFYHTTLRIIIKYIVEFGHKAIEKCTIEPHIRHQRRLLQSLSLKFQSGRHNMATIVSILGTGQSHYFPS